MQNNILENIAITINQHSRRYEARIPNELREYCEIINGRIIKVKTGFFVSNIFVRRGRIRFGTYSREI